MEVALVTICNVRAAGQRARVPEGRTTPPMPDHPPASTRGGSIVARLDRLPPSRYFTRLVALIAVGGWFEFYEFAMPGGIAPGLTRHIFTAGTAEPVAVFLVLSVRAAHQQPEPGGAVALSRAARTRAMAADA